MPTTRRWRPRMRAARGLRRWASSWPARWLRDPATGVPTDLLEGGGALLRAEVGDATVHVAEAALERAGRHQRPTMPTEATLTNPPPPPREGHHAPPLGHRDPRLLLVPAPIVTHALGRGGILGGLQCRDRR